MKTCIWCHRYINLDKHGRFRRHVADRNHAGQVCIGSWESPAKQERYLTQRALDGLKRCSKSKSLNGKGGSKAAASNASR